MGINYISIGVNIHSLRIRSGLTQVRLSELVGCSPSFISFIENGEKSMSLETFVQIADVLNVSADRILERKKIYNSKEEVALEINEILADCTPEELRIIRDTVSSLRLSLRSNLPTGQAKPNHHA